MQPYSHGDEGEFSMARFMVAWQIGRDRRRGINDDG